MTGLPQLKSFGRSTVTDASCSVCGFRGGTSDNCTVLRSLSCGLGTPMAHADYKKGKEAQHTTVPHACTHSRLLTTRDVSPHARPPFARAVPASRVRCADGQDPVPVRQQRGTALSCTACARAVAHALQCLGVRNPANDAPTEIVSCADASAHSDWVFTQPGDNLSIQLAGTNLCAHPPSGMRSSADAARTQLSGRRLHAAEQRAGEGVHLLPGPRGTALVLHA
jgi:hypothetical protein